MGEFNSGGGFQDRELHKATCSECGNECEVPFKPTEGKPVYCRECYRKRRRFQFSRSILVTIFFILFF